MNILPGYKLLFNCLSVCLFLVWGTGRSQNPDREFLGMESDQGLVNVETNDGKYIFRLYTPSIMETTFIPSGEEFVPVSHAVILEPAEVSFVITEDSTSVKIDSDGIDVVISKKPFQVTYFYHGEKLVSEKIGFSEGEKQDRLDFNIEEYEVLMGGGARALGMNRRGNRLELYNRADYGYGSKSNLLNYTLPVVLSSKKYLLHFDNAPIGHLDLDSQNSNTLVYETIGGRKTYQVIAGKEWEDIVGNYTLLTGRQPMPPRWALGNFSSRFGYHSQQEVEETIQKFKKEDIPVDAVILDLFWFGHEIKGTMGNLEFVRDSFPEPEKMITDLHEKGVKTILVTEPFILTTSNRWNEAVREGVLATDSLGKPFTYDFYFGNTGLIDIFDPGARKWFWSIYKDLKKMGVEGWWGDLGEPEVHPAELRHAIGSANEVHNIYGHYWAKLIHDGYQRDFPGERPFILMRAGAAGSQRFGLIPWSGDVSRTWGGLKSQPEIALQMGLQGLAYMHSDLGGFAGDEPDEDLYVRWLQYGVFQPIYRPHAQEAVPSEPVFQKPEVKALVKKAIKLRYRLLPYNYTLAHFNSREGLPLMRPLFFEEPENYRLYSIANTYLWGNDFLISPVMESLSAEKEVYFPKTANWFDFYTGKKYSGGSRATVTIQEDYIPTFVRGGALIPMVNGIETTRDYSVAELEMNFFYDEEVKNSNSLTYNDDGETTEAIERGAYEILHARALTRKKEIIIQLEKEVGSAFPSEFRKVNVIIHNLPKTPENIEIKGQIMKFHWRREGNKVQFPVVLKDKTTTIKISI